MRDNQPVTQREYTLRDDHFLISRTDLRGKISYANPAFIEVSGFSREELLGAPHNLVRHPDMPPLAFENLWRTLKAGGTWVGVIKNRRKNGDHYWVKAHVTPIMEDGEIKGYVSVRLKPDADSVIRAEHAYAAMNTDKGHRFSLERGEILRRGPDSWRRRLRRRGGAVRLGGLALLAVVLLAISSVVGLYGVSHLPSDDPVRGRLMLAHGLLLVAGVPVLALLGVMTAGALLKPLREAVMFTFQIAAGNLAAQPPKRTLGEAGRLNMALAVTQRCLGSIVGHVNEGIAVVTPAARGIAEANRDLSSQTEQQAESLQQTASSMEQITSAVRQNADNARQASELASQAAGQVAHSGEVMGEVVNTMERITASSNKMTVIIDSIDAIAFQTNILALNASVEAARAGEQGRGFAVVASEVRNLAGRSAAAAKEIRDLIANSGREIQSGADLVHRAESTIREVVASVTRVNDIMGEITCASEEQSSGIAQINQAVTRMDETMQHNARRIQGSADAAGALRGEVDTLGHSVAVFHLRGVDRQQAGHPVRTDPPLLMEAGS
ncbi:aerotaxis receptor Aer [Alcanivorax xiamenensis]|uniref:Aerotaxis receptor Aer n=1 Tax=Alcanivorax xiamenensis TaxID=1177156 RepID=A0ABQ6Y310_9GAMM|nr:PAS domain-containing methyl-accepting chemotaxis protein [Alcanivorax xiamenensis]KAF0802814.1 aerotaxis receptor Aer [Alcanivorax xiamenensis]